MKRLGEKKQPKSAKFVRHIDKSFRPHPSDNRYWTLTLPLTPADADCITRYLQTTFGSWPQPFVTRIVCRLLEAVAFGIPVDKFISESLVLSPTRIFIVRSSITCAVWFPDAAKDALLKMISAEPRLRRLTHTDAVYYLLGAAISKYCVSLPVVETTKSSEILKLQQLLALQDTELKIFRENAVPYVPTKSIDRRKTKADYKDAFEKEKASNATLQKKLIAANNDCENMAIEINSRDRQLETLAKAMAEKCRNCQHLPALEHAVQKQLPLLAPKL